MFKILLIQSKKECRVPKMIIKKNECLFSNIVDSEKLIII